MTAAETKLALDTEIDRVQEWRAEELERAERAAYSGFNKVEQIVSRVRTILRDYHEKDIFPAEAPTFEDLGRLWSFAGLGRALRWAFSASS